MGSQGLLGILLLVASCVVAHSKYNKILGHAPSLLEEEEGMNTGSCTQAMVDTAVTEEREEKVSLQGAAGLNGQPASSNGDLMNAADTANAALQSLKENPECAPFLSAITPIAEVQESIEKEATSKREAQGGSVAGLAQESKAKQKQLIDAEAAQKKAEDDARLLALQETGAEGVLKEKAAKQQVLDAKAEEQVTADVTEKTEKTIPAMQKIFEAKKEELDSKFQMKLYSIREHATEEGFRILLRAKEDGEKAFYSPAVRKETRLKQQKKYEEQDQIRHRAQKMKDEQILRLAAGETRLIRKLSKKASAKADEAANKVQEAAHDPKLLNEIIAQNMIDHVAQTQQKETERTSQPAIDPTGVTDPHLAAAIARYNDAVSGKIDELTLEHAEEAANPGASASHQSSQGTNQEMDESTGSYSSDSSHASSSSTATDDTDSSASGSVDNSGTDSNSDDTESRISTGSSYTSGTTIASSQDSHHGGGANNAQSDEIDGTDSHQETAGSAAATMEKFEGHECASGTASNILNDRCYTYDECVVSCIEISSCSMFETDGCQCKFYEQKVDPVTAPGWTCGMKHENGGDTNDGGDDYAISQ